MNFDFSKNEEKILKFWQENKIFEKLIKKNQKNKNWSFLDGPITANNPMGVHHVWGRTYKDLFQRYKAMQGFNERYQNGFDCQGLWVEVEVEKELGFKTKKDIESFGVAEFVQKCKERVKKYSEIQTKQSIRLGQWMDWGNSYYTMSDKNNYAIWGFLKKCHEKGYLYKGRDVVPWCPRCGTSISQHEILTEEYKEITHKAVFVKLPILNRNKAYFLVWTTTPWTLPANVSLAVHPDLIYAEVEDNKDDVFIVLKEKSNLISGGKIIKEFQGKELDNSEYKGMFDELQPVKNEKHRVILWEDINQEEGTGIVHIAPGCGQEDFKLGKEFGLEIIDPTNQESRYKKEFGFLAGKLVMESKDAIFENLKEKEMIYKIEDYTHRYPTCWRCKTELIFRLVDEWYISMDKLRKPLIETAKKINWIPDFGLERELDWLKNMQDWLISKKRYWGLALPIFECRCGNFEVIGSKDELKKRTIEGWDKFKDNSPHKPWIDEIKIKCSKCGQIILRIPDVGNPWLDAGIVPFSTAGYFSDKKYWKKWFPAELVCESFPGQFKNWFYSIIVMSVVLEDKSPVKTIFGYASVRDEKGEEMHKSKGNTIWFDEAVEKIGADPMRWLYSKQNPAENLKFGYDTANETKNKLITLYNVLSFFKTYVKKEEFPKEENLKPKPARNASHSDTGGNILDKWIFSRLNGLIKKTSKCLDKYDAARAVSATEDFFINDLSLWYLRRSRDRLRGERKDKEAVFTFHFVLFNLSKIMAPIVPFFAEEIYQEIKSENMPESVHLCDWPKAGKTDLDLEEKMDKIRSIVVLVLAERAKSGIKVRQPLKELIIKNKELKNEKELLNLLKDEVNVKNVVFDDKIEGEIKLNTEMTEDLKKEGELREVVRNFKELRKELHLTPDMIVKEALSSADVTGDKNFLKEVGANQFKKISNEAELEGSNAKKEIKINGKIYYIGVKK